MPIPGIVDKELTTYDGERIAYQVRGEGPTVVLANGLGGNVLAWRDLYATLGERHRIITWDYRGLYRSPMPSTPWKNLGPREQARDLEPILAAEKVDDFAIIGWSMGVQVAFEVYRSMPSRVRAIGAINGVAGTPFDTVFALSFAKHVVPRLLQLMRKQHALVAKVARRTAGWSGLLHFMQRTGQVAPTLDPDIFAEIAPLFAGLDMDLYIATMQALGKHDAWDVPPTVRVPTSVITGDKDILTPVATARRLAASVPGARLVILPGGTHYTPVEYPVQVGEEILRLLDEAAHRSMSAVK